MPWLEAIANQEDGFLGGGYEGWDPKDLTPETVQQIVEELKDVKVMADNYGRRVVDMFPCALVMVGSGGGMVKVGTFMQCKNTVKRENLAEIHFH